MKLKKCHSGEPVFLTKNGRGEYVILDMKDYDRRRNHWLINQGYKVLRILGDKKDSIPTIERLQQEIDYLLAGHSIGYIDMTNNEQLS